MNKFLMYTCLTVGSLIGGWLGSLLDHGNIFGLWGILFGSVGAIVGIWVAWKISE